jgi:hypothetical protein
MSLLTLLCLRHNVEQEQFGETKRMLQPKRRDIG